MKTAFTTVTILAFAVVSSASADHKVQPRHASPLQLAQALHVQAHYLAKEINYHYSPSEWPHHQMNRISRLVASIERDIATGHRLSARRNVYSVEGMLRYLNVRLRRSVAVHDHGGARHISARVKAMEEVVESLQHSLKHRGHKLGGHVHRGHSDNDHVVVRPGQLHIHRGGLTFGIRLR